MKFFSVDGPFHQYGSTLFDLVFINMLWLLLSVLTLGIGVGASSTALYYGINRSINEDKGMIFRDFFKSFKQNFWKATLIWLILFVLSSGAVFNIIYLDNLPIMLVSYGIAIQLLFVGIYIFPLLAKIELQGVQEYFKVAFLLANKNPFSSILCVIIIGVAGLCTYYLPILGIVTVSLTAILISKIVIGRAITKEIARNEELQADEMD